MITDVVIVGGGPAGSTAAARLAQLGHRVVVVDRGGPRTRVVETLAPGTVELLAVTGADRAVRAAGFAAVTASTVDWDAGPHERRASGASLSVDRNVLDRLLLDHARDQGVHVIRPATVRRRVAHPDGWTIHVDGGVSPPILHAGFLIDASGRRRTGVLPTGPATLAVLGHWAGPQLDRPIVRALDHGWAWCAPAAAGCDVTVFVDPAWWHARPERSATDRHRSLVEQSGVLPGGGWRLVDRAHAADATPTMHPEVASVHHLVIGDAAVALDPLSSTGVQKAIQTALSASIVMNTVVRRPSDAELALQHHRRQIADASDHHARWAAESYATVAATRPTSFWVARAGAPATDDAPLHQRVVAAAHPCRRVRVSPLAHVVEVACIDDDLVTRGSAVEHPGLDRPVAFLGDVALPPLLAAVPDATPLGDVARAWTSMVPLPHAVHIAGWLYRRGVLEEVGAA